MRTIVFCCLLTFSVAQHQVNQSDEHVNSSFVEANKKISSFIDNFTIPPPDTHHRKYPTFLDTNPVLKTLTTTNLGYDLVDGWMGWYKIHTDGKNWSSAQEVCAREGANLLVINSHQEAEAIRSHMEKTKATGKYYWIGFHDIYEEGNYVTIFNESLYSTGYAEWGQNEPDVRPGEDCGVLGEFSTNKTGLGDFPCSITLPYICEEEIIIKQKSIPTPQKGIPTLEGYELIPPLTYYKYHQNFANWQEAVNICSQEGTHLLIINSELEKYTVKSIVNRYRKSFDLWIGIHDNYEEGNYVTIFNDTLQSTGYTKWYPGKPTKGNYNNCLKFVNYYDGHGLSDQYCSSRQYFICEYEV